MSVKFFFALVFGWLALSLCAGAGCMKYEWNYFVERPEVFDEVRRLKSVNAVGYFDEGWYDDPSKVKEEVASNLRGNELYDDPYYHLIVRPFFAARDAGVDALAAPEMPAEQAEAVLQEFLRKGLTVESADGYRSNTGLHGAVMSFESEGESMTILVARGGQVSNDHYPFYEALFDDKLNLVRSHMFYFDVAGLEGPDGWPTLLLMSLLMGLLILFLVSLLSAIYGLSILVQRAISRRHGAMIS